MNEFGSRLKEMRNRKGLTGSDMAAAIGESTQNYWCLENGKSGRMYEKLPRIAKTLGCRIDDLFPEMDEPEEDDEWLEDCKGMDIDL